MEIKPETKIHKNRCNSCPFGGSAPLQLETQKLAEIYQYLAEGENHLCHSDRTNTTICRGGRDWQLNLFRAFGWIVEPTDEALGEAMEAKNITPKSHIVKEKTW